MDIMDFFSGDYVSALKGCCSVLPQILDALEIDLDYLAHPPTGTGVPRKKGKLQKFKFLLKIQRVVILYNVGASESILTNLFQAT